jgi:hypothetical protein
LHDKVAVALEKILAPNKCKYDQHNDLIVCGKNGRPLVLYEIKTAATSQSVYTGVGQLMLNACANSPAPKRVLVLPGDLNANTSDAIKSIGIEILSYRWKGKRPVFPSGSLPRRVLP